MPTPEYVAHSVLAHLQPSVMHESLHVPARARYRQRASCSAVFAHFHVNVCRRFNASCAKADITETKAVAIRSAFRHAEQVDGRGPHLRASRSASVNNTRVTAGQGSTEKDASSLNCAAVRSCQRTAYQTRAAPAICSCPCTTASMHLCSDPFAVHGQATFFHPLGDRHHDHTCEGPKNCRLGSHSD